MKKLHEVEGVIFDGDTLILRADGGVYRVSVSGISPRLARASDAARQHYEVSPSGYGLHWPEVDEDLSVDGLIRDAMTREPAPRAPAEVLALHDTPPRQ